MLKKSMTDLKLNRVAANPNNPDKVADNEVALEDLIHHPNPQARPESLTLKL